MTWKTFAEKLPAIVTNKYLITGIVLGTIILFVGRQSVVQVIKQAYTNRKIENQLQTKKSEIQQCTRDIQALHNTDSLERYAREHYYMHTPEEDVYLVAD